MNIYEILVNNNRIFSGTLESATSLYERIKDQYSKVEIRVLHRTSLFNDLSTSVSLHSEFAITSNSELIPDIIENPDVKILEKEAVTANHLITSKENITKYKNVITL